MNRAKVVPVNFRATFFLLCLLAFLLQSETNDDQQLTYKQSYCSENGHYDKASQFENNLNQLFYNLNSKSNIKKFYNFTVAITPNELYGLFLCNSLVTNQLCQHCVLVASEEIQRRCPFSVEAITWYEECMIRYANRSIFSTNDVSVFYDIKEDVGGYDEFNQILSDTFINLFNQATSGNSSLVSATGLANLKEDTSLGCYVDCTPDLTDSDCHKCLKTALGRLQIDGSRSGGLFQPSCQLKYDFSDPRHLPPENSLHTALVVILVVVAVFLLLLIFVYLRKRQIRGKPKGLEDIESMENLHFEFDAIKAATDNFSPANTLGQGGFGVVYMGELADGQAVAVKRLSNASRQGLREFKTEACLAVKLQHKNLVKLFGFCLEGNEMLLVYEFVPNKSLDRYLFGPQRRAYLNWQTRYKIIVGIARGLLYLHEDSRPTIIHRDLKPSNILLDEEMNPKIADFGMAKLFGADQTQGNTTRVAGTFGYMAPEYATTGHFSVKSDVFSYGVIVLETISDMRNSFADPEVEDENLINYAWRLWNEGCPLKLVDSTLGNNFSQIEVERCIHVGLLCIQEDRANRPNTSVILRMLNTEPLTIEPPLSPPPFKGRKPSVSDHSYNIQADEIISSMSPR